MIVITGATGALNGATVDHLLTRTPASEVVVAVREPQRAQRFADLGVAVRHADYADPASLPTAFEGADQLLLVSSNDPQADAVVLHSTAIDAAVDVGVGRILYTSHQGAALQSPFPPAVVHAETERRLAACGLPWTSLRNGFYAHSLAWLAGPWRETGVIAVPGDGPVSWTAREDAAEAAAIILATDGGYDGSTTLTATTAPTFAEVALIASELTGSTVTSMIMDEEDWVAAQHRAGAPEARARMILGMYQAASQGLFAGVDPLLASLLGREPRSVREALSLPVPAAH